MLADKEVVNPRLSRERFAKFSGDSRLKISKLILSETETSHV